MRPVPDRFFAAVRALTADEPAKQRLITAYVEHLETLHPDDIPESIRPRFESLRKAMNSVPPTERETAVQVSVRKMSPADAGRYTLSILMMFAELVRVKNSGERLNSSDGPKTGAFARSSNDIRVPTFLARSSERLQPRSLGQILAAEAAPTATIFGRSPQYGRCRYLPTGLPSTSPLS